MNSDQARKNENQFTKILLFALSEEEGDDWEEDLGAWRHKALPVYRSPQGEWTEFTDHRSRWIYFLPKTIAGEPLPADTTFPSWIECRWDSQAGRWVVLPSGGSGEACIHAVTPIGGIAGMVGSTMQAATCELLNCSDTGLLSSSGESVTVYNPVSAAIGANKRIVAMRNMAGLYVAIVEPCA